MGQWTTKELRRLYDLSPMELISQAHKVHARHHDPKEIQVCTLISVKTGGCPEDCKYCPQSSHYHTNVKSQPLLELETVVERAKKAAERGVTRICLGAAWRRVRQGRMFDQILKMIPEIKGLGLEVCCTLGALEAEQAQQLKEAGAYAYNHNVDSSESFYKTIITTRPYAERLETHAIVEEAGLSLCCGGILGMGESVEDRLEMLCQLANRSTPPESVPINRLMPVKGTPLGEQPMVPIWELIRIIAIARITMPKSLIRLSAGRVGMSIEEHALCFFAGANSIHDDEQLLTVPNPKIAEDMLLFQTLKLTRRPPYAAQ